MTAGDSLEMVGVAHGVGGSAGETAMPVPKKKNAKAIATQGLLNMTSSFADQRDVCLVCEDRRQTAVMR